MSRIGRKPINIPAGVTAKIDGGKVAVKGPLGELLLNIAAPEITIKQDGAHLIVQRASEAKEIKSKHGLYRALLCNNVNGVTTGFDKFLVVKGVGYKSAVAGDKLTMNIGYSHPVEIVAPAGVKISIVPPAELPQGLKIDTGKEHVIKVSGIDRELVGHTAARIKASKPVEPYHGYGIHYSTEAVVIKEGKTAGK